MSRECSICKRKTVSGNNVSHSHLKTKRRWKVNLQKVRALVNGMRKKIWVCTSCIKSGRIVKA